MAGATLANRRGTMPALPLSERRKLFVRPLLDMGSAEASSSSASRPEEVRSPGMFPSRIRNVGCSTSVRGLPSPKEQPRNIEPGRSGSAFQATYELAETLGAGSMTVVRLARRRATGEEVAVKCTCTRDEEVQAFTREEYNLMCELRHPSILRVLALYENGLEMWLCMELCRDGCLEVRVQELGVFNEASSRALFLQLLEGVHFLHRKRIVHRDLKPANLLLLNSALELRIADFNSAKRIGTSASSSIMLTDRGTHLYSAPELRFGRLWNERVDIWACGLCLFFMLRSSLPFNAEGPGVAKILLSGRLPDVAWGGMNGLVKNIIQQCLTVNMQDRPPAMELLAHPLFNAEWPGVNSLVRQPVRRATGAATGACPASCGGSLDSPRDLYALLPACGLLRVMMRRCPGRSAASGLASTSPRLEHGGGTKAPSIAAEPEECLDKNPTSARPVVAEGTRCSQLEEAQWRVGVSGADPGGTWGGRAGGKSGRALRQLARTKCERTLDRECLEEGDRGMDQTVHRGGAQNGALRRWWTEVGTGSRSDDDGG
uniref:Protein kinase domain-containing protein n=1 Tax=Pyrodinium bahamense TaxID=73915 RepID=A0A7S0AFE7_9DINO